MLPGNNKGHGRRRIRLSEVCEVCNENGTPLSMGNIPQASPPTTSIHRPLRYLLCTDPIRNPTPVIPHLVVLRVIEYLFPNPREFNVQIRP